MITFLVVLGILQTLAIAAGVYVFARKKLDNELVDAGGLPTGFDKEALDRFQKDMNDKLKVLPEVVLHTIQGSANSHKGKFGELIGYINLKAQYDRIIPLGTIVDFMGITYPKDGKPGKIDFIDIKTGDNARLTKDQRAMKQLLINKNINFITMKIDSIEGVIDDGPDTDRSTT